MEKVKECSMNKKLSISITFLFLFFLSILVLDAQWARTYGGDQDELAWSIQQTDDGGYIAAGWTESFAAGDGDIWILKLNPEGDVEWEKTYGGIGWDLGGSIQQTADGGYILGGTTDSFGAGSFDRWILKLDSSGGIEWQRTYGGVDNDLSGPMYQTTDGGYIVSGRTYSFGAGPRNLLVLKLNSSGDIEWQRTYGTGSIDFYSVDFQQTNDGGFIAAGDTRSFGAGQEDMWILKLDSVGKIEWQRTFGGSEYDRSLCIQQANDSGYIVLGYTKSFGAGDSDILILKLSSIGEIEWQSTYGGSDSDSSRSIQQTYDGGYIIAGGTSSFGAGDSDMWVLKLDTVGDIEWQRTYGGIESEWAYSIQQSEDGGYIVAGYACSFGAGDADVWILKLDSNGEIDLSCGFIGSSDAIVSGVNVVSIETNVEPQDTDITPQKTYVSPQDTIAFEIVLCSRPTPEEQIENLIDEVENQVNMDQLNKGRGNALIVKLEAALQMIESENVNAAYNQLRAFINQENVNAACNQLRAFINHVKAYIKAGIILQEEGQALIDAANLVILGLCS